MEEPMADNQVDLRMKAAVAATALPPTRRTVRPKPEMSPPESDGQLTRPRKRGRSRKGRRLLLLLVCTVVTGTGVAVWRWWTRPDTGTVDPATTTTQVIRRDFSSSVVATGAVKPQVGAQVRVGARVSGKVEKLRANIGDSVRSGQVIAELEKADLQAIVAQRQAELDLAEAKLAAVESLLPKEVDKAEAERLQRQATLALAQQDMARGDSLLPSRAMSQEDYDHARERLHVGRAAVTVGEKALELAKRRLVEERRQAVAEIARAKETLNNAKVQLSYATLVAPISGVIGSVATQEGETVAAGLNSPTFVTIIDLDRLEVDAMVDEVDIGKVRVGQKAMFTVDSFPAREFPGKVVAIYPDAILLENVVYYDVVVEIQGNEDKVLRPQMTASATIFLDAKTGVLAIPTKAVKRERGKNVVYVMKGREPQPREVKVGWKDGSWIEVVSGLQEGETVLQVAPTDKPTTP
jgi:multidrug efflux pump subunit AcrA (membrane-fusion protein)